MIKNQGRMSGKYTLTDSKADLRGIFIPEILFKLDIEMTKIEDGDNIVVLLDDLTAEDWIIRWAHKNNHDVASVEKVATGMNVTINKGGYRVEV